jgi:aromatic ring hydroxylase
MVAALPLRRGSGSADARHESDATYGRIGRSPGQVAGLITGLAMKPTLLDAPTSGFGENLTKYYEQAHRNDLYIWFAVDGLLQRVQAPDSSL